MKRLQYQVMLKRKKWALRIEIAARQVERWLDENLQQAFFGFFMTGLFLIQVLLFLSNR